MGFNMVHHISANDLKTKGISAIESLISDSEPEAMITVHGKVRFVVIPVEAYNRYRELELALALEEVKRDYREGRYTVESAEAHMRRLAK